MLQVFRISGFPLFTKSSQVDQHWIGVNLFHPVLISNWRKLRRHANFSCLHTYWMWCVLQESILLLVGDGGLTFRQFMSIAKCYGKISIRRTMNWFEMGYFLQFTKFCLVKKHHVCLQKGKILAKNMETSTWHQMECISELPVAQSLHTGCHILYLIICCFKKYLIKHMLMVWMHLFTKTRKVFSLRFHWLHKFARLRISSRCRMMLVC